MNGLSSEHLEDHSRTIIHFDLDCFYAQVEMIKKPELFNLPLGIQQKNIVVTSNYVAREFGIKKCMLVTEARKVCPNIILVKGEDLYEYRQMSNKVTTYLQKYSPLVERLGLDENYIDVTNLVSEKLKVCMEDLNVIGHVFGNSSENCQCGCQERLKCGSVIAQEIRNGLKEDLKVTSCAGIAHNKLLAKVAGAVNKPNQQTTVFPNSALELMLNLKIVRKIPGIGSATAKLLEELGIVTIENLHDCDFCKLKSVFGVEKTKLLLLLSYGKDTSAIKPSGRPQSIGLEDSCKSISVEAEIKDKFHQLLRRLMILVSEDGRIPHTLKLTVRKFNNVSKVSHKETRQCNINSNLFLLNQEGTFLQLTQNSEKKLMSIIMHLFAKLVDVKKSFHVTLLGLSFTKFHERANGKNTIASYFIKDIAVQSLTSFENKNVCETAYMDYTNVQNDFNTDGSESEVEPSPKKTKLGPLLAKRRCFVNSKDCASPSKLKVSELRLNSKEMDNPVDNSLIQNSNMIMDTSNNINCPPNADPQVFKELPQYVQQELWDDWKSQKDREQNYINIPVKKPKMNTLLNYFVKH